MDDENIGSWFHESSLSSNGVESDSRTISHKLGLKSGDVVWIGRRKRTLEGGWTIAGRLRAYFINVAESLGFPTDQFILL